MKDVSHIAIRKPAASRLLSWLMLLAFAVQGFLVQTHIHGVPARPDHTAQISAPAAPVPVDPFDPASCPLCQEMFHAGVAITPDAPQALLLLSWVATAPAVTLLSAPVVAIATGWQSRAPPRR